MTPNERYNSSPQGDGNSYPPALSTMSAGYNSSPQGDGNSMSMALCGSPTVTTHPRKGTETPLGYHCPCA